MLRRCEQKRAHQTAWGHSLCKHTVNCRRGHLWYSVTDWLCMIIAHLSFFTGGHLYGALQTAWLADWRINYLSSFVPSFHFWSHWTTLTPVNWVTSVCKKREKNHSAKINFVDVLRQESCRFHSMQLLQHWRMKKKSKGIPSVQPDFSFHSGEVQRDLTWLFFMSGDAVARCCLITSLLTGLRQVKSGVSAALSSLGMGINLTQIQWKKL